MFKKNNIGKIALVGAAAFSISNYSEVSAEELSVRGIVSTTESVTISSDSIALISSLPWKAGDAISKGDVLVAFDCARHDATLKAAQAEWTAAARTAEQQRELFSFGAAGQLDLDVATAEVARAAARAAAVKAQMKTCAVEAPFDGRVAEVAANAHETAEPGAPILTVIKGGELEIEMIAPSAWLRWIRAGATFEFTIDETGETHRAEIVRLGARVDPVSQTIAIIGRFTEANAFVLDGMSGAARFSVETAAAQPADRNG